MFVEMLRRFYVSFMERGIEGLMNLFDYSIKGPSGRIYEAFDVGMRSFYSRSDSNAKVGIFVDIKSYKFFLKGYQILNDIICSLRIPKGGHEGEIFLIFYLSC